MYRHQMVTHVLKFPIAMLLIWILAFLSNIGARLQRAILTAVRSRSGRETKTAATEVFDRLLTMLAVESRTARKRVVRLWSRWRRWLAP